MFVLFFMVEHRLTVISHFSVWIFQWINFRNSLCGSLSDGHNMKLSDNHSNIHACSTRTFGSYSELGQKVSEKNHLFLISVEVQKKNNNTEVINYWAVILIFDLEDIKYSKSNRGRKRSRKREREMLKWCFTSTETQCLLGAQDVHLTFTQLLSSDQRERESYCFHKEGASVSPPPPPPPPPTPPAGIWFLAHNAKQRAEGLSKIWSWWGPLLPWPDTVRLWVGTARNGERIPAQY